MTNRIKAPLAAVAGMLVLSGCGDLLDVDNPNSLVEESVQQEAAANGMANGSLWHTAQAISAIWQAPEVVSDNVYWIGSRDAWGALDEGFISDNANEFTDAAFPWLGQAVWVAQNAVEVLDGHASGPNGADFQVDYGRTLMFRGLILMVVAESQSDMTFSNKQSDGPPVSSGSAVIGSEGYEIPVPSMDAVMQAAITSLTSAKAIFVAEEEADLALEATALLARAEMSRVIMAAKSDPCDGTLADCALDFANAVPHAIEVLADGGTDYRFNLTYSAASTDNDMASWINDRKENQIDLSLVTVDDSNDINGIQLKDVVDGTSDDLALIAMLNQWKGGSYLDSGNQYPDLTVSSARLMHLILAESAAAGNAAALAEGTFVDHINNLRAIDGYTVAYAGGNEVPTLIHHRRVNTVLQGLRLQDMYRWGIASGDDPNTLPAAAWQGASDAAQRPGSLLPITLIEVRANCHLNGLGCG